MFGRGYRLAAGEGRAASRGIACENRTGDGEYGVSQELTLNRTDVAPLVVRHIGDQRDKHSGARIVSRQCGNARDLKFHVRHCSEVLQRSFRRTTNHSGGCF